MQGFFVMSLRSKHFAFCYFKLPEGHHHLAQPIITWRSQSSLHKAHHHSPQAIITCEVQRGSHLFRLLEGISYTEDQRDTPKRGKRNHHVNDTRQDRPLSAKQPCDRIKAEKTDAAPVESANGGYDQGDSIKNRHHNIILLYTSYLDDIRS